MGKLDDFTKALSDEALAEMAESFFGARKDVETEKELFQVRVERVRQKGRLALDRAALLHALLLDGAAAGAFYAQLGVDPGGLLSLVDPNRARLFLARPVALTARGRYAAYVLDAYATVQESFGDYLHGQTFDDMERRERKVQTMSFLELRAWCAEINKAVKRVNDQMPPSMVLEYAHNLDVEAVAKEAMTGATLDGFADGLDRGLRIPPIDWDALGLAPLPELPPPREVGRLVRRFAKDLYGQARPQIEALFARLAGGG